MSGDVAVTAWAVWNAAGVSVNAAPVLGGGVGLAPWPDGPAPPRAPVRARPRPARAAALVQLVQRLLSARRERFPAPELPAVVDLRLGTVAGSRAFDLEFLAGLAERGDAFGSPSTFAYTLSTSVCGEVSLALGLRGALSTVSSGGVSGLAALVIGAAQVADGRCEACICGGMDVSGSNSDLIALFLLEARAGAQLPRLIRWELAFDPDATQPSRPGSSRPPLEDLAAALAAGGRVDVGASGPDGHSALLTVAPHGRPTLSLDGPAS
jgi:hypothetical protein